MYSFVLILHSIIRWLALILLIAAFTKAWIGLFSGKKWSTSDRKLGISLIASLHTQLLLGLLLYIGLSPVTSAAFKNMGAAMKDATLRFWAVEHIFTAVIGIAAAQVGFTLAKRAQDDRASFIRAAAGYTLGLLCIIAAIPWPFRATIARPLLPF
jgi:hypothetical protein